jgi:hypothetical protein
MFLANGAPSVRIWVVGTHRILGVVQQGERFDDLPAEIRTAWSADGEAAMWERPLFGDFRVCPLTPSRPGRMQSVHVEGGRRLRLASAPLTPPTHPPTSAHTPRQPHPEEPPHARRRAP